MERSMCDETRNRNPVTRAIVWHYSNTKCTIKPAQYERVKFLISKIRFNPWLLMPAAIVVQICCGSLYAWSVFNAPIDQTISGDSKVSQAPITFYIAAGMLGTTSAVMGPYVERQGPRKALILSAHLFLFGHLLSALAIYLKYIWLLYITYGLIGGFSIGFACVAPVSTLQKWFPHKRGLAGGVAVSGFCVGSIVVGKVILPLIDAVGLPLTFAVLGTCYYLAIMCSAFIFRVPPPGYSVITTTDAKRKVMTPLMPQQPEIKLTLKQSIKSTNFLFLYVTFLTSTLFGVLVISRLADMTTKLYGREPNEASTIVSLNGIIGLFGRLFFSAVSDKIGRKTCFLIMLTTQAVVISTFPIYMENGTYWIFLLCMFVVSLCYGACFGVLPAFVADLFGTHNVAVCFGVLLTAWSTAGTGGGLLFTVIYNHQIVWNGYTTADAYPYIFNSYWILALVVVGLVCAILIRTQLKDRLLPPADGQWFRFRLFNRMVIVKGGKIKLMSSEEYDQLWENYLNSRNVDGKNSEVNV